MAVELSFREGYSKVRNKIEGVSVQDGEDTTRHGDPQACILVRHPICYHLGTIGESYG